MFRKCLIIFCCIGMLGCVVLAVGHPFGWPTFKIYGRLVQSDEGFYFWGIMVHRGRLSFDLHTSYDPTVDTSSVHDSIAGIEWTRSFWVMQGDSSKFRYLDRELDFHPYLPFILFAIYPIVAFIRGPLRRRRRRRRNLCPNCGYPTTGNVTGVCPECGGKVDLHRQSTSTEPKPREHHAR